MNAVRPRRISVIGAGRCGAAVFEMARSSGGLLAQCSFKIGCGGLGGVSAAKTPQQAAFLLQTLVPDTNRAES